MATPLSFSLEVGCGVGEASETEEFYRDNLLAIGPKVVTGNSLVTNNDLLKVDLQTV